MPFAHRKGLRYQPGFQLTALAVVAFLGFGGLFLHNLSQSRRVAEERAAETAANLIAVIRSDVSRTVETLNLSLQAVDSNLRYPGVEKLNPELRQLILFDRSATARHLGIMAVFNEHGDLILDSQKIKPDPINCADRDYFQVHRKGTSVGLYIGQPYRGKISGEWFIGVSRRLSNADGSFAGIVMASLRLSYFVDLFRPISLGHDGNVTLARTDGTVLMRWPFKDEYLGASLKSATLYGHLAEAKSGAFKASAMTDGVHRLVAYSQIDDLPLVISVGQATSDIYAQWRFDALVTGIVVGLLCLTAAILACYALRELRRRKLMETKLADMALFDHLTGLSNRLHFNEIVALEWRGCEIGRKPLTLMMIDADFFKSYNDTNGHQAGDLLLQTLGATILKTARSDTEFGARFGGDEFIVLLSGGSLVRAEDFAATLRQEFSASCRALAIECIGLSIGIASVVPAVGESYSKLLNAADAALYLAKRSGRNVTAISAAEPMRRESDVAEPDRFDRRRSLVRSVA
ncbi:MAG: diguanylate cyclase [Pseudorhodoplanes sp.]